MADAETVRRTAEFHGHMCPGLAMGIRAAEVALQEIGRHAFRSEGPLGPRAFRSEGPLGPRAFRSEGPLRPSAFRSEGPLGARADDEEVVAIVETDMCGVDAIQFLLGCTFGKGNLVHRDYGKNAYTLIRRSDGKAVRISERPGLRRQQDASPAGPSGPSERETQRPPEREVPDEEEIFARHRRRTEQILGAPLEELYDVREVQVEMPHLARVFASVDCATCGEATMETRIRRLDGQELCPPCFEERLAAP